MYQLVVRIGGQHDRVSQLEVSIKRHQERMSQPGVNIGGQHYRVSKLDVNMGGVRHVTGNDKDYLRKIPRVVW